MRAEIGERGLRHAAAPLLRLREQRLGLVERDGEQLIFRLEAAGVGHLLQIGPVAPVLGGDLRAVAAGPDDARQRQQRERLLERDRRGIHAGEQRRALRLVLRAVLDLTELDERSEPAGEREHGQARVGVGAEHARPHRPDREQLLGAFGRELVGREVGRDRRLVVTAFDVGAVGPHPHDELATFTVAADVHRVHFGLVDRREMVLGNELAEPDRAVSEVEGVQPLLRLALAERDRVERLLHGGRELVVDEVREVTLEELHLRERGPRRHERGALLPHVVALVDDGVDDARVRGRAPDAALFQLLHETGFGVPRRRLGGVTRCAQLSAVDAVVHLERRQDRFSILELRVGVVGALDVRAEVTGEFDRASRRLEHRFLTRGRRGGEPQRDAPDARVGHLRRDGALPHEVVEAALVGALEVVPEIVGGVHAVACGTDRLVRLLRVLHLAAVRARCIGQVVVAVHAADLRARGLHRLAGERRRVGAHVRDETALVEPLGDVHRARGAETELARCLLLERRRDERRLRPFDDSARIDGRDRERLVAQARREGMRGALVEQRDVGRGGECARVRVEITAGRETPAVERGERGGKGGCGIGVVGRGACAVRGGERALEVPVGGGAEGHAGALAVDHQPGGHALHPSCGRAAADAADDDVRHLVAHEAVEQSPALLCLHQLHVDVAPVVDGVGDRLVGDLVEHHALHRHPRLQHLEQVPRDRLALAVLVGREVELARVLQRRLQLGDDLLLVGGHDVHRREVVVDVDAEPPDLLVGDGLRRLARAAGQVADVTHAGEDDIALATEEALDRLRFCFRLDNDERSCHGFALLSIVLRRAGVPGVSPRDRRVSAVA